MMYVITATYSINLNYVASMTKDTDFHMINFKLSNGDFAQKTFATPTETDDEYSRVAGLIGLAP